MPDDALSPGSLTVADQWHWFAPSPCAHGWRRSPPIGAMVVLSIGALFLYRDISSELSGAITDELTIRVDDLAANVENGSISSGPSFVLAQVVSLDGAVLSPPGAEGVLTTDELSRASRGDDHRRP